jgi:transposase
MQNREIEPTNNGSERGLRPCAIYRKITNVFRIAWAG